MNKNNHLPEIGDLIMILTAHRTSHPIPHTRGRPPKKPKMRYETVWEDTAEAIVVNGPNQGISSDGEDYWLEWTVTRLDNNTRYVISSNARVNNFRILNKGIQ